MCRSDDPGKPKDDRAGKRSVDEFKDMFATPAPGLDELLNDPIVRGRIGEWISLATNRATRRPRPRR